MNRRSLITAASTAVLLATAAFATPAIAKWPPWLSIESPVNPYDASARGALLLVHASFREGVSQLSDVSGSAEGIVNGARRSVPLRFESTGRANIYALRRQWPTEGRWVLKIALRNTTAVVSIDPDGSVGSVQVPTERNAMGDVVPRAVTAREVDSLLTATAKP
jgi:hypothetical protein